MSRGIWSLSRWERVAAKRPGEGRSGAAASVPTLTPALSQGERGSSRGHGRSAQENETRGASRSLGDSSSNGWAGRNPVKLATMTLGNVSRAVL